MYEVVLINKAQNFFSSKFPNQCFCVLEVGIIATGSTVLRQSLSQKVRNRFSPGLAAHA